MTSAKFARRGPHPREVKFARNWPKRFGTGGFLRLATKYTFPSLMWQRVEELSLYLVSLRGCSRARLGLIIRHYPSYRRVCFAVCSRSGMCGKPTSPTTIQVVIDLHRVGHSAKEICELKGLKQRTVYDLIKKFRDSGSADLPLPKKAPGKTPKTSPRTRKVLARQLERSPGLTARELKEQNPLLLRDVSIRCVQETLKRDLKFKSYRARKKPLITEKQKAKRKLFCKNHKDWDTEKWRSVLWSDESTFCVSGSASSSRVYRRSGSNPNDPRFTVKTTKHPQSVMVWGSFGYHGLGDLVFLEPGVSVNKEVYWNLLLCHLESSFEKAQCSIFQQDGAPAHTARDVTGWLKDCEVECLQGWPGNSPDISPIENLWAIIKAKLRTRDTSSLPKLRLEIQKCWDEFNLDICHHLADSVPRRLKDVLKLKGNAIKY